MEPGENRPVVIDSSIARAVVLVVSMLTAGGEMIAAQPSVNEADQASHRIPDVARIEPNVNAEVVLFEAGVL